MRQCVSKAEAEGVPFGSQEVVSWTGGGFKVACSCFAGLMSLFEWVSDGGYAVVAESKTREFGRVGCWASRSGCLAWLSMGTCMDGGVEAWQNEDSPVLDVTICFGIECRDGYRRTYIVQNDKLIRGGYKSLSVSY